MVIKTNPLNLPEKVTPKEVLKTDAQKCREKGGAWDGARCIMPTSNKEDVEEQQAEKDLQIMRESSGFQIGNRKVTKEEYYRIKSQIPGTEGGSRGGIVTEEDKAIAASLDVTPEQTATEEERARLIAEETPERRELDPVTNELEVIPVVGALLNNIQRGIKSKIPWLARNDDPIYTNITPENLRTAAFTEIERREIEGGLTESEKFGRFAESINLGQLEKYIPGLGDAELPSGNVQTVVTSIRMLKTRATDVETKVKRGLLTPEQGKDRIRLIENELQAGESRMKLLIQNSPELKFNSDGVNFIEGKVLEARERIFDAKLTITEGATSDPSEYELLAELQNTIDVEDFDIPGL